MHENIINKIKELTFLKKNWNFYEMNSYLKTRINQSKNDWSVWSTGILIQRLGSKYAQWTALIGPRTRSTKAKSKRVNRVLARTPGPDPGRCADPQLPKTASFFKSYKRLLLFFFLTFSFIFFSFWLFRERDSRLSLNRRLPVRVFSSLPSPLRREPPWATVLRWAFRPKRAPFNRSEPPGSGSIILLARKYLKTNESELNDSVFQKKREYFVFYSFFFFFWLWRCGLSFSRELFGVW